MSTNKPLIKVVCTLICDDAGRFLVCRRPVNKSRGGLWEFVGGKIENGETPEDAVVRECREELDITVEVIERVTSTLHEYPDIVVDLAMYRARIVAGTPDLLEHSAMKWVCLSECDAEEFCPADAVLIEKLKSM